MWNKFTLLVSVVVLINYLSEVPKRSSFWWLSIIFCYLALYCELPVQLFRWTARKDCGHGFEGYRRGNHVAMGLYFNVVGDPHNCPMHMEGEAVLKVDMTPKSVMTDKQKKKERSNWMGLSWRQSKKGLLLRGQYRTLTFTGFHSASEAWPASP